MQKSFNKDLGSLESIFKFLHDCLKSFGSDSHSSYAVRLSVEELFTNMVKYSPEGRDDVTLSVCKQGKQLVVILIDHNVDPFDVTATGRVRTDLGLDQRTPGGLGIHLVKTLMDSVDYTYADRCSTITLKKTLEK